MRVFADGVMETYMKDHSGDHASPINGRLAGLFFMTAPDVDGQPPKTSAFGPMRLQVLIIMMSSPITKSDEQLFHGPPDHQQPESSTI